MHARQLVGAYDRIRSMGANVLVVAPGDARSQEAVTAIKVNRPPFPVLGDPELALYHALGLERLLFGLTAQIGSLLIHPDGEVAFLHKTGSAFQSPDLDGVLRALAAVSAKR